MAVLISSTRRLTSTLHGMITQKESERLSLGMNTLVKTFSKGELQSYLITNTIGMFTFITAVMPETFL